MHVHMSAGTHANSCRARGRHLVSHWMVSNLCIEAGSLTEPRLAGQLAPVSGQALYRLSHSTPSTPFDPIPPHPTQPFDSIAFIQASSVFSQVLLVCLLPFVFSLCVVKVDFEFAILLPQPSKYWKNQLLISQFHLPPLLLHPNLPYNLPS